MKKLRMLVVMLVGLLALPALSQETAVKVSVKDPTFRIEAGKALYTVEDLLGISVLDFRIWAGAGAAFSEKDGRLVGSVAALWTVPKGAKNVRIEIGPEYHGVEGEKSTFDLVAQFTMSPNQAAGLAFGPSGRFGLFYCRRL